MSIWMRHYETDWKDDGADLEVLGEEETIYVDEIGAVDKVQHTNAITLKFSYPSVYSIYLYYDDLGIHQLYSKESDEILTYAIEELCQDGILQDNILTGYFDVEKQGNSLVGIEKNSGRFATRLIEEYCEMFDDVGIPSLLFTNVRDGDSFEEYCDGLDSYDKETVTKVMTEKARYTLVEENAYDTDLMRFDLPWKGKYDA